MHLFEHHGLDHLRLPQRFTGFVYPANRGRLPRWIPAHHSLSRPTPLLSTALARHIVRL